MDNAFLQARIDDTQAQIIIFEDALTAFGTSNIQSYTIDTGQGRQVVTRAEISSLNKTLGSLYNRLAVLETRLTGCGSTRVIPVW